MSRPLIFKFIEAPAGITGKKLIHAIQRSPKVMSLINFLWPKKNGDFRKSTVYVSRNYPSYPCKVSDNRIDTESCAKLGGMVVQTWEGVVRC